MTKYNKSNGMSRRDVLGTAAMAMFAAGLPLPVLAQGIGEDAFLALSQKLTVRAALDPVIARRALAALSASDPLFAEQAATLGRVMEDENFTDMGRFAEFAARHPDLRPVALSIIKAWYVGYTGTPAAESTVDDARFVSYAGALMYEPTIDATVIPSYARGHTNYWAEPPATLATD